MNFNHAMTGKSMYEMLAETMGALGELEAAAGLVERYRGTASEGAMVLNKKIEELSHLKKEASLYLYRKVTPIIVGTDMNLRAPIQATPNPGVTVLHTPLQVYRKIEQLKEKRSELGLAVSAIEENLERENPAWALIQKEIDAVNKEIGEEFNTRYAFAMAKPVDGAEGTDNAN
ncbi:hypothetical protein CPT_Mater70 [Bacillus phage Mater]|uniref:Uncharacterized protein n=1 Tax=Bacillus phage Mater TaxID=1540090 RepID=A0A0A0RMN2_9CAUD|nr:hypothetical protein CPT_Mater70 [Bacillus phage Mater]AIW03227.1 hypothetical protein CPT_Mater70 [Bacillus phage Mater]